MTQKSKSRWPRTGRVTRSSDLSRLLVDSVQQYAIFALDPGGHVLTWNDGARRIKGYAADEIIGKHFSLFYPPEANAAQYPRHELEVAAAEGHVEDEGWRVRKDGSLFWASVAISALRDSSGALVGFGKVTRDLTARRAMEETLRRSEQRFRLLVQGVRDYAIFMLDPGGHVVTWNEGAEALKGYTASEIVGKHFSIFYPQKDVAENKPARELVEAAHSGRYEEEGWRVRKNGSRFWASVLITALRDETGRLVGFAKVTRDLSERRAYEQRIENALSEAVGQRDGVLAVVAHDLRSPLNTIAMSVSLLRDPTVPLAEGGLDTHLDTIQRATERMTHLIRDLLDVTMIETGRLTLTCRREEASPLAAEVCDAFRPIAAKKDITLICHLDPASPRLLVDRGRIIQVLSNFLSNAVKFTPRGGRITVRVQASGDGTEAQFAVTDTGPGIPPDHLPHVFERFWQAGKTAHLGSGLGLAIAKGIAEAHQGKVMVESEIQRGATFVLSIPVSQECPPQSLATTS